LDARWTLIEMLNCGYIFTLDLMYARMRS
jgi:hypothetical protein